MRRTSVSSLVALLLILSCTAVVRSDVITEEPQDKFLPLSAEARFTCTVDSTLNISSIIWTISTRNLTSLTYNVQQAALNSFGIKVLPSTSDHISVLSVKGELLNNNTAVMCSVTLASEVIPVQSRSAKLTLYGPPDPVAFTTVITTLHSFNLSWSPVVSNAPFNYSISISTQNSSSTVDSVVLVDQSTLEYLFEIDLSESCKEYNFTIHTVNEAGSSAVSDILTLVAPEVPGIVSITSHAVLFEGSPLLLLTFPDPSVCSDYPVTQYQIKLQERTHHHSILVNTSSVTDMESYNMSHDGHVTLLLKTGLLPDRRYLVSVSAINEVGASPASERIEIVTTNLQGVYTSVLLGEVIQINCHFANGSTAAGGYVLILSTNGSELANETLLRDSPTALNSTGNITLVDYHRSLVLIVFDYYSDGTISNTSFTQTVFLTPAPITGTVSPTVLASVSAVSTHSTTPLTSVMVTPAAATEAGVSQIVIVAISASVAVCVVVVCVVLMISLALFIRKSKKKPIATKSVAVKRYETTKIDDKRSSDADTVLKSDTLKSASTITSGDIGEMDFDTVKSIVQGIENLVEPYGITNLVKRDPLMKQPEPLYQELPETACVATQPHRKPPLCSQSSTTPLLESQQSNVSDSPPPPPIAPRYPPRRQQIPAIPVYHELEENAAVIVGSLSSSDSQVPSTVVYDEVPFVEPPQSLGGADCIDGPDSPSADSPSSTTPMSSSPPAKLGPTYHVLESQRNGLVRHQYLQQQQDQAAYSRPAKFNTLPHRQLSTSAAYNQPRPKYTSSLSQEPYSGSCPRPVTEDDVFDPVSLPSSQPVGSYPTQQRSYFVPVAASEYRSPVAHGYTRGQAPPRQGWYSRQASFCNQPVKEMMKKSTSLPLSMVAATRDRCNSGSDNDEVQESMYDRLERDNSKYFHGTWTMRRTLV